MLNLNRSFSRLCRAHRLRLSVASWLLVLLLLPAPVAATEATTPANEPADCSTGACHPQISHPPHRIPGNEPRAAVSPCRDCHEPHSNEPTPEGPTSPARELCLGCHEHVLPIATARVRASANNSEDIEKNGNPSHLHGPLKEGRCGSCHRAHASSQDDFLRGALPAVSYLPYRREAYSACLGACHQAEVVETARTTTATLFRNGEDNLHYRHVVAPRRGRSCPVCHAAHRSDNSALLLDSMPMGNAVLTLSFAASDKGGRCETSCHMPLAYDREEFIPSPMRIRDRTPEKE